MSYVGKGPIDRVLGLSQKNTATGDGSTTSFDILTQAAPQGGDTAVDVFVDNVRQEPGVGKAYVLAQDGSSEWKRITFSTAPASGAVIWTNNRLRTQITNILPGSNTITNALINDSVITGQSALGTTPAADDTFLVYDESASGLKKVAYSDVHSGVADMAANTVKVRDANTTGTPSDKAVTDTQILIGDGTGFTAAALSSDVTMTNAGAVTIANDAVTSAKIINNAVNGAKIAMGSDAAGDILTYNGTDYIRLAKGTAAQVLKMNAGATAVEWGTAAGGIAVPGSSVAGDTLYHNGTIYTRLAKGTASQVLTMNAGATAPEWVTPTTYATTSYVDTTAATVAGNVNELIYFTKVTPGTGGTWTKPAGVNRIFLYITDRVSNYGVAQAHAAYYDVSSVTSWSYTVYTYGNPTAYAALTLNGIHGGSGGNIGGHTPAQTVAWFEGRFPGPGPGSLTPGSFYIEGYAV